MKLNIYGKVDGKKEVVKTYEAETYDLMYGTVEDFLQLLDVQNVQMVIGETVEENKIIEIITNLLILLTIIIKHFSITLIDSSS